MTISGAGLDGDNKRTFSALMRGDQMNRMTFVSEIA